MKDYYTALEIGSCLLSKKARYNKYVRLSLRTEDLELKRLLKERLRSICVDNTEELRKYCQKRIDSKVPLWEFNAVKNKWKRP